MSCDMWFGTKDYAQFIRTPQTGADVSPQAWGSSGTLLNGSGYVFNSFNSHKEYSFSWGATAAREAAQTMKSYFDGSFGRGKLHFVDPLTYSTNVLPARWADPSITADFEGPQLVPGVDPYTVPTSNFQWLRLPVRTAVFDLDTVQPIANTVFLPEAENLFTNPNLVGDGTWAEVRRNLALNPTATLSGAGWGSNNQPEEPATRGVPVPAPHPDGITTCVMQQSIGNRANLLNMHTVGGYTTGSLTPGTPVSVYVWVSHEGYRMSGSWGTINPFPAQEWVRLETVVAENGSLPALAIFTISGNADPSHRAYATGAVIGDTGPYFDGSTTPASAGDIDQPEDFRWRWLGTPNASESVMEIERVRGLGTTAVIAGVSSWEGKPAVRLIPTAGSNSRAHFDIPLEARARGTLIGTAHLKGPITSPQGSTWGVLRARTPNHDSPAIPVDKGGSYQQRVEYSDIEVTFRAELWHGDTAGRESIWWTDIGLFAGDYTGPWFSGDTEILGKVTRWTGAPNNSTSQIGVLQPVSTPNVNEENSVFVPIPDGMQLNVGAFYSGSPEAGVYVVNATQGGSPGMNITRLQPLTPSDTNILPNVFTKAPGDIGVYIIFGKLDSVDAILSVTAIHARLSPIGVNPQGVNYWLGGQGNEGVRFVQPPTYINHTGVNGGQVEFAATFKESIH